jgi:SAM-dependent methyltransferase
MPKFIGWVPTQDEYIDAFFELAPLSPSDVVYDLGSGDGRLLFAALEKGAGHCVGIDIDPERVNGGMKAAESRGLDEKCNFIEADVLETDLSSATVILCYLYPTASAALRSKFEKELKPGTRVVMESFPVPGWKIVRFHIIKDRTFYLYTMPPEKTADYDDAMNYSNFPTYPYDEYSDYGAGTNFIIYTPF